MKVGIACVFWGTPKGHSYVNRDIANILLEAGHEVYMYRYMENAILPEFPRLTSLKSNPDNVIPKDKFEAWLDEVKPDVVFFNEYDQWWQDGESKVLICKNKGIKTVGYLVWEKLEYGRMAMYNSYGKIICPTGFQTNLMRKNKVYNSYHTPWGVDLEEIDRINKMDRERKKLTFYHCAGSGGVGDRKNTKAIIAAYNLIKDDDTELLITHLNSKTFVHDDIIRITKHADVVINTSRWDTMGINTLEANACGKPVIVCDAPPMNELVKDNINGFVVPCQMIEQVPYVTCPSAEVDIKELAKKMAICKNELILNTLKNNSRKFAETNFNWKENKKRILEIFERWN